MEQGSKSIELRQFRIQILQTRESEQEPRELARLLIHILCIMPAVLQGYCGSSVQDEDERAQAGEHCGSYYRSPGEKFRCNNEDLSLGGGRGGQGGVVVRGEAGAGRAHEVSLLSPLWGSEH